MVKTMSGALAEDACHQRWSSQKKAIFHSTHLPQPSRSEPRCQTGPAPLQGPQQDPTPALPCCGCGLRLRQQPPLLRSRPCGLQRLQPVKSENGKTCFFLTQFIVIDVCSRDSKCGTTFEDGAKRSLETNNVSRQTPGYKSNQLFPSCLAMPDLPICFQTEACLCLGF